MMRHCAACGRAASAIDSFCRYCGASLTDPVQDPTEQASASTRAASAVLEDDDENGSGPGSDAMHDEDDLLMTATILAGVSAALIVAASLLPFARLIWVAPGFAPDGSRFTLVDLSGPRPALSAAEAWAPAIVAIAAAVIARTRDGRRVAAGLLIAVGTVYFVGAGVRLINLFLPTPGGPHDVGLQQVALIGAYLGPIAGIVAITAGMLALMPARSREGTEET